MNKQELEKLIEAAEYCMDENDCENCTMFNECEYGRRNSDRFVPLIGTTLPLLKELYQLKYGEPKTNDEQLNRLIEGLRHCGDKQLCFDCVLHTQECTGMKHLVKESILPYLEKLAQSTNSQATVKEEIDTTKDLTTGQMIDFLAKNPTWRAKDTNGRVVCINNDGFIAIEVDKSKELNIGINMFCEKWQLIPPEPVEVDFAEAFKANMFDNKWVSSDKATYKSGNIIEASKEEISGKWIIL